MSLRPAAFIDRDGVLNEDTGYVYRSADFRWLDGVFDALALLRDAGRALVVVTNQSGIARGLYTEDDHAHLCAWMHDELRARGLALDAIYHCPHLAHAQVAALRVECNCRKPRPGMILRACAELGLDLGASCLFGDKASDIAAGRAAGVRRNRLIDPRLRDDRWLSDDATLREDLTPRDHSSLGDDSTLRDDLAQHRAPASRASGTSTIMRGADSARDRAPDSVHASLLGAVRAELACATARA